MLTGGRPELAGQKTGCEFFEGVDLQTTAVAAVPAQESISLARLVLESDTPVQRGLALRRETGMAGAAGRSYS